MKEQDKKPPFANISGLLGFGNSKKEGTMSRRDTKEEKDIVEPQGRISSLNSLKNIVSNAMGGGGASAPYIEKS
jgi:hypothetical protein